MDAKALPILLGVGGLGVVALAMRGGGSRISVAPSGGAAAAIAAANAQANTTAAQKDIALSTIAAGLMTTQIGADTSVRLASISSDQAKALQAEHDQAVLADQGLLNARDISLAQTQAGVTEYTVAQQATVAHAATDNAVTMARIQHSTSLGSIFQSALNAAAAFFSPMKAPVPVPTPSASSAAPTWKLA